MTLIKDTAMRVYPVSVAHEDDGSEVLLQVDVSRAFMSSANARRVAASLIRAAESADAARLQQRDITRT